MQRITLKASNIYYKELLIFVQKIPQDQIKSLNLIINI